MDYDIDTVRVEETFDDGYDDALDEVGLESGYLAQEIEAIYQENWNSQHASYEEAVDIAARLDTNPEAIWQFCVYTSLSGDDGLFVSALINEDDDDYYLLPDMTDVHHIGERNKSLIRVEGDVGDYAGSEMAGGHIHVAGDAGVGVGKRLIEGSIRIDGNTGSNLGDEMGGGIITVRGDTGKYVGRDMADGIIAMYGDLNLSRWWDSGDIYTVHDGELHDVVPGLLEKMRDHVLSPVRSYLEQDGGYVEFAKKRAAAAINERGSAYQAPLYGIGLWASTPILTVHRLTGRGEAVAEDSLVNLILDDEFTFGSMTSGVDYTGIATTALGPPISGYTGFHATAEGLITPMEGAALAGPLLGFMALGGVIDAFDGVERTARSYCSDALLEEI